MAYTGKNALSYLEEEFKKKAQEAAKKAKAEEAKQKSTNVSTGGTTSHKGGKPVKASQSKGSHQTSNPTKTTKKPSYEGHRGFDEGHKYTLKGQAGVSHPDAWDKSGSRSSGRGDDKFGATKRSALSNRNRARNDDSETRTSRTNKTSADIAEANAWSDRRYNRALDDSLTGRVSNITHGSAESFAGAQLSSVGTAMQKWKTDEDSILKGEYIGGEKGQKKYSTRRGDRLTESQARRKAEDTSESNGSRRQGVRVGDFERVYESDPNSFSSGLIKAGDTLQTAGSNRIERAKEGLGTVGKLAVDLSSNALMMAGDGLLNLIAPGAGLASLANRSGGMASYEMRQQGFNPDEQYRYALATSAVEVLSEQIGNGVSAFRGIYGKGAIDMADSVATRLGASRIVQDLFKHSKIGRNLVTELARLGVNMTEEGLEEVVADLAEPALKYLITKDSGGQYDPATLKEMGYDYLIGSLMALAGGGGVDVARNLAMDTSASPAMVDGALSAASRSVMNIGLAQNEGTTANYLANAAQEQINKGGIVTEAQVRRMQQATNEARIENEEARQTAREEGLETAARKGDIKGLEYQGTRAESYEEQRYGEALERQAEDIADQVADAFGEEGLTEDNSEQVMAVARALTGNATTVDIDTILSSEDARTAYEKVSGMELSVKNSEARKELETQSNINEISNSNKALQLVWNDDADIITKSLSANLEGNGRQIFMENLAKGEEAVGKGNYARVFDKIYTAGTTSTLTVEDAMHMVDMVFAGKPNSEGREFFSEPRVKEIFLAGRADTPDIRTNGTTLKSAKKQSRAKGKVQYGRGARAKVSPEIGKALEKIAENGGVTIKVVKRIETNNPYAHANGKYEDGVIYLAVDSSNPLVTVAKHELTHWIKEHNLDAYKALEDFVFEEMYKANPDQLQDRINYYTGLYSDLSIQEVKEEILADMSEAFFTDEGTIKEVVEYNRNLGKAIKDGIHNLFKGFTELRNAQKNGRYRGYGDILKDLDILTKAEAMWADALEGASTATVANEKDSAKAGNTKVKHSLSSIFEAVGCNIRKEGDLIVATDRNGKDINKFTPGMVKASPLGRFLQEAINSKTLTVKDVDQQTTFLSDLFNLILTTQDPELIWAVNGSLGYNSRRPIDRNTPAMWLKERTSKFAAITSNSDPQYQTTIDFTTICVKTQAIIDAMSKLMIDLGRGLSEHEIIDIVYKETHNAGEPVPCPVCYVFSRWVGLGNLLGKIKQYQIDYPADMDMTAVRAEYESIRDKVDMLVAEQMSKGKKKDSAKARNTLYKETLNRKDFLEAKEQLKQQELSEAERQELADIEQRLEILDHWAWLEKTRLAEDYKEVPDKVLFDLNAGRTFATDYAATWRFRTTRGPSLGKAVAPYSPARLGDITKGIASPSTLDELGRSERKFLDPDENEKEIQGTINKAIKNAKRQNRMNGQRLQSTSDFRFEYALDYLLAYIELEAIGAKTQLYTKVPEAVKFLASMNTECNCSIMAKGTGLDENGDLVFSDVTGMHIDDALALSKMYDNVQPILVAIGREHLIKAMASKDITMIIPYHSSGSTKARYRSMMEAVEEAVESREDFAAYENEFKRKNATAEQKVCRNLREDILTGEFRSRVNPEGRGLDAIERKALQNNEILRQLYIRVYGEDEMGNPAKPDPKYVENFNEDGNDADCLGVFLTDKQAEVIMPYEYWDKTSTSKDADKQGQTYVEYCTSLGLTPVFSGWTEKGKYNAKMDFTKYPGYWKTLIDRCMYNNDGTYHKQKAVNVNNVDLDMFDANKMRKGLTKPMRPNDPLKTEEIVKRSRARIEEEQSTTKFSMSATDSDGNKTDSKELTDYLARHDLKKIDAAKMSLTKKTDSTGNTLSSQQIKFFEKSKAVDIQGRLAVVYHTTDQGGFTVFNPKRSDDKRSLFFASNFDVSQTYSRFGGRAGGRPFQWNDKSYESFADFEKDFRQRWNLHEPVLNTLQIRIREAKTDRIAYALGETPEQRFKEWLRLQESNDPVAKNYFIDMKNPFVWGRGENIYSNSLKDVLNQVGKAMSKPDTSGYYQCYLNLENPLVVDGKGHNWNGIPYTNPGAEYDVEAEIKSRQKDSSIGISNISFHWDWSENGFPTSLTYSFDIMSKANGWENKSITKTITSEDLGYGDVSESGNPDFEIEAGEAFINDLSEEGIPKEYIDTLWEEHEDFNGELDYIPENPSQYDFFHEDGTPHKGNSIKKEPETTFFQTTRDLAKIAKKSGYDGLIIRDITDIGGAAKLKKGASPYSDIYVAFNSNQVKLSDNKNPTSDSDIRYSLSENRNLQEENEKLKEAVWKKNEEMAYEKMASEIDLEKERRRRREAVKEIRTNKNATIEKIKQHHRDVEQAKRERRQESEERTKLLNIARRLDKVKTNTPTKQLINEFIGDLDLVAKSMTGKTLENLNELSEWYDEQRELDPFFSDSVIEKKINRISKKQISDMDINDVRDLTTILKSIEASIRNGNKFVESSYKHTMKEAGLETMKNINKSIGLKRNSALGKLDSFFINETLSPVRQIRRITGYVDDDPLYIATQELADGQRDMMTYEMNAWNMFTKFTEDKKFVESLNGKKARPIQLMAVKDGQTVLVKVTPDIAISLYLSCMNEDNLNHIGNGGVNIPDFELYRKGNLTEAYENSTRFTFSKEMLEMIESRLTTKEKALANTAYNYFNEVAPNAINRVSNILKGYDIATVKNYFPIMTDKNFLTHEFESLKFDATIEGQGSLKERVRSELPIEINGIVDTLTRSIKENSMYVGLAIPVRNMNKLLGVKDITWVEKDRGGKLANNLRMELHATYNGSVEESIRKKWGQPAMQYIENFMTDLQTSRTKRNDWVKTFNAARSNYAGAVLTFNASVAIKQAASYPTAAAVLGTAPLIRAMGDLGKVDLDLIAKYTPLQWYRSKGFSTPELGDIRAGRKGTLVDKATSIPALNWIQTMDILTTRKLWKASEYYVRQHSNSLEVGSDEYYKVVADIYNRVIEETQPNYAIMQRPALLRSDDSLVQTLNMFKTQPYQNFNILYDAIGNYIAKANEFKADKSEESRAAAKEAQREMQKAVTSQFMQLAVFAAMGFAWAFFRGKADKWKDEEEDKITINSFLKRLGVEMVGGSFAMLPFGADILYAMSPEGLFQDYYFEFSSTTDSAINDFLNTGRDMMSLVADVMSYATMEDKENYDPTALLRQIEKVIKEWGRFAGIPTDNLKKTYDAIYRWTMIAANGKYVGEYLAAKETLQKDSVKKMLLYKAYRHDPEQYELLRERMIEDGFDEDDLTSGLNSWLVKNMSKEETEKFNESMDKIKGSTAWQEATDDEKKDYEDKVKKYVLGISDSTTSPIENYAKENEVSYEEAITGYLDKKHTKEKQDSAVAESLAKLDESPEWKNATDDEKEYYLAALKEVIRGTDSNRANAIRSQAVDGKSAEDIIVDSMRKENEMMSVVSSSSIWENASEDAVNEYTTYMRKIALGIEDGETTPITKKAVNGVTTEQVILYKLALKQADAKANANGHYDSDEKKAALAMLLEEYGLTPEQQTSIMK